MRVGVADGLTMVLKFRHAECEGFVVSVGSELSTF